MLDENKISGSEALLFLSVAASAEASKLPVQATFKLMSGACPTVKKFYVS